MSKNYYGNKSASIVGSLVIALIVIATIIFLVITFKNELNSIWNKFKDNSQEIIDDINNKDNKDTEQPSDSGSQNKTEEGDSTEITPTASLVLDNFVIDMSYLTC